MAPRDTAFSHIILPLALLNQALDRIHRSGWLVETIAWDRAAKEVLVVCSNHLRLEPLEGIVYAGDSVRDALGKAGLGMGIEKEIKKSE